MRFNYFWNKTTFYYLDGTAHGAFYFIRKIEYNELLKYEENYIQAISVTVNSSYEITVTVVYCPPRHNSKKGSFGVVLPDPRTKI